MSTKLFLEFERDSEILSKKRRPNDLFNIHRNLSSNVEKNTKRIKETESKVHLTGRTLFSENLNLQDDRKRGSYVGRTLSMQKMRYSPGSYKFFSTGYFIKKNLVATELNEMHVQFKPHVFERFIERSFAQTENEIIEMAKQSIVMTAIMNAVFDLCENDFKNQDILIPTKDGLIMGDGGYFSAVIRGDKLIDDARIFGISAKESRGMAYMEVVPPVADIAITARTYIHKDDFKGGQKEWYESLVKVLLSDFEIMKELRQFAFDNYLFSPLKTTAEDALNLIGTQAYPEYMRSKLSQEAIDFAGKILEVYESKPENRAALRRQAIIKEEQDAQFIEMKEKIYKSEINSIPSMLKRKRESNQVRTISGQMLGNF
ncbi:MAG: hypothetical protein IBX55_01170 [Methyloprofundus sp.]|nr:hypothetical protein [Methyloprofundus sp.]